MENFSQNNSIESNFKKKRVISNMVLLLLGRLVSLFGTQIYNFAVSFYILSTTGSGKTFALSLVFGTLPRVIFGPIAGVVSDKIDRKKMVIIMDILSGIVVLSLFGLAVFDSLRIPYIYATSFLLSTCNTFFDIPLTSSMPNLVDENNLTRINSLNQSISSIATIAGPFLGGMIFALVNMKLFLIINGISFIISGITEMFIDFKVNKTLEDEVEEMTAVSEENEKLTIKSIWNHFTEGFSYLKSSKSIFTLSMFCIFLNFFIILGLTVPFPYMVINTLGLSSTQLGSLESVFPFGMLVGSIILSILPQSKKNFKKIILGLVVTNIGCILLGITVIPSLMVFSKLTYFILYIILFFIIALAVVIINVPLNVTLQKEIPDNIRGRIFGTMQSLSMGLTPVGMIISGILLDLIPVSILPISTGVILMLLTLMMAKNKDIREL